MKIITILLLTLGLLGCANQFEAPNSKIVEGFSLNSDELLMVVKVKKTKYTGYSPASSCEPGNCITWSSWYVHEAEVLEIIKGNYVANTIKFANLQHADYIDEIKNEWYIQLKEIPNQELRNQLETKYFLIKHDSEFQQNH